MRTPAFLTYLLSLSLLVLLVQAWTKEDHEIFRLRDEVALSEGPDTTFYDFIGVSPAASWEDINKAFRKKSRSIHPDKAKHNFVSSRSLPKQKKQGDKKKPGVHVSKGPSQREIDKFMKEATQRYSRLGVVANVLKGPQRQRYDHFLKHGFPAWRGTGYYYSRYRPGLGTVLVGLFIAGGGIAHYYALKIGYNRQVQFMDRYIKSARKSAWGSESGIAGIPGVSAPLDPTPASTVPAQPDEPDPYANLNRRQKREMEKQNKKEKNKPASKRRGPADTDAPTAPATPTVEPQGERRRVTAENGKVLLVDAMGNVFLEEEDEEGEMQQFLLDLDDIHVPTVWDTAVFKLPVWAFRKAFDPFLKNKTEVVADDTVPRIESEVAARRDETPKPVPASLSSTKESTPDLMSASQEFEMIGSVAGIEKEMLTTGVASSGNSKKRNAKKGKK